MHRYEKYTVIKDESKLAKATDPFAALYFELLERTNDLNLVRMGSYKAAGALSTNTTKLHICCWLEVAVPTARRPD